MTTTTVGAGSMHTTRASNIAIEGRGVLRRGAWVLAVAALAVGTVGCVATAETTASRGVVVSGPPPAPLTERRPEPPAARAAWVPGYWHWTGMQYAWIPGHWDAAGQGSTWVGPRYFQQGGQYRYEAGGWARGNALR